MSRISWRPDQRVALEWMEGRDKGALWSPTGSGKTAITATWLDGLMMDRLEVSRALVVAPKLVTYGWMEQMARWDHLNALAAVSKRVGHEHLVLTKLKTGGLAFKNKARTKNVLQALPGRVHVCSWDAFPWVEEAYGANWPYEALVLDESSFVRDPGSARARAARRAVHKSGVVTHLMELTATPNANHDEAVFSQLDLVERGCLGANLTEFRETYCLPDSTNRSTGQVYSWRLAPSMRAAFEHVCARLALSMPESLGIDVLEVPHWLSLGFSAQTQYRRLERESVLEDVTAANAAVLHAKLRQFASGFVYRDDETAQDVHEVKRTRLSELMDSIEGQVLLAYEWTHEREQIAKLLGRDFQDIRQPGAKARFERGELRALGVHPKSAGHGLDGLQSAAHNIIWTTVPEDRELYDQTNGRLKRPGQREDTVFVHLLVMRNTREEQVWTEVLPGKRTLIDLLLTATA